MTTNIAFAVPDTNVPAVLSESDVLRAVSEYTEALLLLDQYDHQVLKKPGGTKPMYRITYEECTSMVSKMRDSFDTDDCRVQTGREIMVTLVMNLLK